MRTWAVAFLIGVFCIRLLPQLPNFWWSGVAVICLIPLGYLTRSHLALRLSLAILLGFCWAATYIGWHLAWKLPQGIEGKTVTVVGHIANIPQTEPAGQQQLSRVSFAMALSTIQYQGKTINSPIKVRLNWYGKFPRLNVGDQWELQVRLKRPNGFMNPGGFDYEAWLLQQNIRATGYVVTSQRNHLLASHLSSYPLDRLRENIHQRLHQALASMPYVGIIAALTIGLRDGITQQQWQVFRGTGTSHLVAISGLHIGLVAGFIYFLLNFLWRRFAQLTLRIPAQQAAAIAALIAALIYSALAGFALPTQRALVMIAVFMSSYILRRTSNVWNGLSLAMLIIIGLDPLAVLSASFWLSFSAVGIILYGMVGRLQPKGIWWKWGRVQWLVTLGLIPLSLLLFQQASLIGLLANFIAIPWVGFIVVPLSLLGSLLLFVTPHFATIILLMAEQALAWLWPILSKLASLPGVQWHQFVANGWVLVSAIVSVLLLLAPRGFPARWLGIIGLLPLGLYHPAGPKAGQLWLTMLDVGQGLSAVVRTQHHVLLFDTGPKYSAQFDTGASVVVPFLRKAGINNLDMMVISHGHNDHIGGAAAVLASIHVKKIMTSVPQRFKQASHCLAGEHWSWDGVEFRFLYPLPNMPYADNDSSCVLRVTDGKNSILLPGDLEKPGERYLVAHAAGLLPANILIAPHHGSRTSSTVAFVAAVHPQYVLFPVGYRNRYRFPSQQVIPRYQKIAAIMYDSVAGGAITFKLDRQHAIKAPLQFRQHNGHFWNVVKHPHVSIPS